MEEQEKLQKIISDLQAEIEVLSVQAESAEDPDDKKFYRRRLLMKEERLLKKDDEKQILLRLLEKDKDVVLKEKELLVKKEDVVLKEKEFLVKEKELLVKEKELLVKKEDVVLKEKEKELLLLEKEKLGPRGEFAGPQPNVDVDADATRVAGAAMARSVSISSVNSQTWKVITAYGLPIMLSRTAPLTTSPVLETEPFSWQPQTESDPINRKAAVQYLNRMVPPPAGQEWYDSARKRTMLSCSLPMASTKLKGTCDVALCTSAAIMNGMPENGLRIVVELKKDESKFNIHQLATELLSANMQSPVLKPIGVMTDLMDAWCLMWATEKKLEMYKCRGRAEAFGILRAFLEQERLMPNTTEFIHQQGNGGSEAEVGRLLKRWQFLSDCGPRADVADLNDLLDFGDDRGLSDTDLHQLRCATQLMSLMHLSPRLGAAQDSWNSGGEAAAVPFPMYS